MADLTNKERIAQQLRPIEVGNAGLAILGTKFNDLGGGAGGRPDGIRQANEPGLPNVRFLLEPTATSNGVFNPSAGEAETTTDANGAFSFINLVPGSYVVTELPFAGFTPTTPSRVPVTIDNRNVNVVFGNSRNVSLFSNIVGCKYLDLDDDGFRDGNEPGIRNVRIYLDGSNTDGSKTVPNGTFEPGEYSTLTDKNGEWSFNGIAPGTYRVREVSETRVDLLGGLDKNNQYPQTLKDDFPQTTPPNNVPLLDVTVAAGETFACAQVGDTQFYQIVVNKFEDLDRNGRRNIVGASLERAVNLVPFILDTNKNGKFDVGEEIQFTKPGTRNGIPVDGEATFENLRAGNYPVLEIFNTTLPRSLLSPDELSLLATRPELTNGVPSDQFRPGNLNLPVPTTPNPLVVAAPGPLATPQSTISRNEPFLVADSTYTLKPQDPKFIDLNGDGFQQLPGEVSIRLPGDVSITPRGLRPIYTNTRLPFPAPNPESSVDFSPIAPNNTVAGNTGVGNTRPNINIFKYNDENANGRFDPQFIQNGPVFLKSGVLNITGNGEEPLPGVKFFIDLNNDGDIQANEPTRTTDVNGRAVIQNLTPGTYTVREKIDEAPLTPGFLPSAPAGGAVTFTVNTEDANVTFGNTPKSKITGCKFEDFNQNGYRDGNEPGISGITVYLDLNNNGILDTEDERKISQTTDGSGTFKFENLSPGTYSLREDTSSVPSNLKQTTQPLNIDLGPNQTFTCALIGNVRLYDLKVPKFQDDNRDGIQNFGEQSLNNIPFALDLNKNGSYDVGEPLARTGAGEDEILGTPDDIAGKALFKDLLPGTYSVLEVFNDPKVPNPFPIRTGPNPVSFDVPGPDAFFSPVRPQKVIKSLDLLTGDTGVAMATATADPLTNGGSSLDATVQASSVDSLIAPQSAAMSFVDLNKFKDSLSSLTTVTTTDNSLDKLLLGAPATTPLF